MLDEDELDDEWRALMTGLRFFCKISVPVLSTAGTGQTKRKPINR